MKKSFKSLTKTLLVGLLLLETSHLITNRNLENTKELDWASNSTHLLVEWKDTTFRNIVHTSEKLLNNAMLDRITKLALATERYRILLNTDPMTGLPGILT